MDGPSESDLGKSPASFAGAVPPFIGRKQQLDLLERCLQDAIVGRPQVVLIRGDAGVGKTRLLKEVRSIALNHGVGVCSGRFYEDLVVSYLPFVESLLSHLGQVPEDVQRTLDTDMQIISQFLHRAGAIASTSNASLSIQDDQDKLRLFLALSRATIKLAQSRSTLLVLDDLHWADRPSLDLFSHLVFAVADAAVREPVPLLIIGAYRPVEPEERLARAIARFQRENICQTLELPGLNESEVNEFIQGLGVRRPSHQLVTTVNEATQGNPLFIQEVLHHLVKQNALEKRAGYVVTTVSPSDLRLPEQVTVAIATRTQGLSEGCRRVLTLASFLGDRFSLQTLSAVSEVSEDELLNLLEEGMHQRLLLSEGQTFQFAHPLIRHVFYNEPSMPRRQRIHQQIAHTLERLYADSLDEHILEVAHHLVSAGPAAEAEKVVEYARRAGDQAFTMFAWGEAARYYEAALSAAQLTGCLSTYNRGELHYLAGYAHYRDMDVGPCLDHYEKAIEAYRLSGDVRGLALALTEKTRAHFTLASVPYGTLIDVQPLEEVLKALGDQEPGLRGRIWAIMHHVYWTARQPDKAEEIARRALEIGQHIKDDPLCAEANVGLALAQTQSLQVREALESYQNALVYARRADDLWRQGWPLQRMPLVLTWLGRLDEAEAVALEACELIHETHDWGGCSLALATLMAVAVARGDFDATERHAHEAMMMVHRSRYPWGGAMVLPALACARSLRGAWAEAEDAIDILVEPGRVFEEPGPAFQAGAGVYRQLLRAHSGALDEVRGQLAANPRRAMGKGRSDIASLARSCALVEIADLIAAPTLAEHPYQALSLAAERGVVFSSGWLFMIPRVLGVAATLNRWWDKAEAHFQAAIETATRVSARPELGRSYLDYARMLAARGSGSDRRRAIELVGQATLIFNELGMEPFAWRAARLAEALQASIPLAPRQPALYPDNLSGREVEVLRHIARSRTDQEIADELVLSPQTVTRHVSTIFNKTGVNRRTIAAAYAVEKGLASQSQSPLLIILVTDMEGSTALIQRLGDEKAQELLRTHNTIIRDCLRKHSGSEIKHTGDGVMASFPSASGAIECAMAIQKAFAKHNQKHPDTPIRVRIGLNAGEPIAEEGQLFGTAVNAAARICARARPGQILVSDVIRQLAAGKGAAFTNRGRVALKGFSERFRLYEVQ
ncbi:MAG: AAA family ATPase, partial [Deltaproteobacteria bacterium]|nr:AAA family ATPase [Deltaproteobacteria bacterium]